MSEPRQPRPVPPRQPAPAPLAGEIVLGRLDSGAADSSLEPISPPPPRGPFSGGPLAAVEATEAPFSLPADAWLGLRWSGGLRFIARQVIVYADGRIVADRDPVLRPGLPPTARWRLTGQEAAELVRLFKDSGPGRLRSATAAPSPDGYVYELAIRTRRTVRLLTWPQHRLPAAVAPLLRYLRQLLNEG